MEPGSVSVDGTNSPNALPRINQASTFAIEEFISEGVIEFAFLKEEANIESERADNIVKMGDNEAMRNMLFESEFLSYL